MEEVLRTSTDGKGKIAVPQCRNTLKTYKEKSCISIFIIKGNYSIVKPGVYLFIYISHIFWICE